MHAALPNAREKESARIEEEAARKESRAQESRDVKQEESHDESRAMQQFDEQETDPGEYDVKQEDIPVRRKGRKGKKTKAKCSGLAEDAIHAEIPDTSTATGSRMTDQPGTAAGFGTRLSAVEEPVTQPKADLDASCLWEEEFAEECRAQSNLCVRTRDGMVDITPDFAPDGFPTLPLPFDPLEHVLSAS